MNEMYNRSWKQLKQVAPVPVALSPRPVARLNTQWRVVRLAKAAFLYVTTRYSWHLSWLQAAR